MEKMTEIKAAVLLFFSALGTILGWKGIMLLVWLAAMAADYISGTLAARRDGAWSSAVARTGLFRKFGMIMVVGVAGAVDLMLKVSGEGMHLGISWPGAIMPLVAMWYIITELGSILENAVKLGAQVPKWLEKGLEISLDAVDGAGEAATGTTKEE